MKGIIGPGAFSSPADALPQLLRPFQVETLFDFMLQTTSSIPPVDYGNIILRMSSRFEDLPGLSHL